jgi:threonine/homoserine/homoserine lactone efflux protein
VNTGSGVLGAVAFGFALGLAPGPVQLLILAQTARRGVVGGLEVMLGANLTLLVILLCLALGLSALEPSETTVRVLRVVGGTLLIVVGALELRALGGVREAPSPDAGDRWGPTAMGIVAVLVNPGAWLFVATTASAVLATAAADDGRTAAVVLAVAITVGVTLSDLLSTLVGTGGRRLAGDRGIRWLRSGLAIALIALGAWFIVAGARG